MGNRKSYKTDSGGLAQLERVRLPSPPPMYRVWLLNDDYTPMEFVIEVLKMFFDKHHDDAEIIMYAVHTQGRAVCGEYPRDIAETKVARVLDFAREHEHPLQCVLEGI